MFRASIGRENIVTAVLYFHSSFKDNEKRDGVTVDANVGLPLYCGS